MRFYALQSPKGEEVEDQDPDFKEFEDLINPFVEDDGGPHPDRDYEPRDPGWLYPDNDRKESLRHI